MSRPGVSPSRNSGISNTAAPYPKSVGGEPTLVPPTVVSDALPSQLRAPGTDLSKLKEGKGPYDLYNPDLRKEGGDLSASMTPHESDASPGDLMDVSTTVLSLSSLSPRRLRGLLPAAVAALLQEVSAAVAVVGRRQILDAQDDISTFSFVPFPPTARGAASQASSVGYPPTSISKSPRIDGRNRLSSGVEGPRSSIISRALNRTYARVASSFVESSDFRETSSAPFDGNADAYVHETSPKLGRALFNAAGPLFILRAGRPLEIGAAQANRVQRWRHPQRQDAALVRRTGDHGDQVHALDPLVLAENNEGMYVVMYKQVRTGVSTVVELLHHLVIVEGPAVSGGEVVLYFEPFDDKALQVDDAEAFDVLNKKRRDMLRNSWSIVSGFETGYLLLTPDAVGFTQVMMTVRAEYDVALEEKSRLRMLQQIFAPLLAARQTLERRDFSDELKRRHFINVTIPKALVATAEELAVINEAFKYNMDDSQCQRVRDSLKTYPTISMFTSAASSDDKLAWGKGYGDVDGALEEVFAYVWLATSYERVKIHRQKHGDTLLVTDANDGRRSQIISSEQKIAPTIANRWYKTKLTWMRLESGDIAVALEPTRTQGGKVRFTEEAVEGKTTGLYLFKAVASFITTFTIVQTVDLGGAIPKWMTAALLPTTLSLILRAQERFRRPDKTVDKEMREAIAAKIEASTLGVPPDEKDMFDECSKLKDDFERDGMKHLVQIMKPPSPFIKYSMRPAQKRDRHAGMRQAGTGHVEAVVDASLGDAAAWIFDYCSRERMRINTEENKCHPRIISRTLGSNSVVFGTIKEVPFPLWNREFVVRISWAKIGVGHAFIWAQSVSESVDYGVMNIRKVAASTSMICELVGTRRDMCTVSVYQKADSLGWVPISVVDRRIAGTLSTFNILRQTFQRDEEVDEENRQATIAELNCGDGGQLNDEDQAAFASISDAFSRDLDAAKLKIKGGADSFVKVFRLPKQRRASIFARVSFRRHTAGSGFQTIDPNVFVAELSVDADIQQCVAWMISKSSRQRTQSFFDKEGGTRRTEKIISRRRRETNDVTLEKHRITSALLERREVVESVWSSSENGSKYTVFEQSKDLGQEHLRQVSKRPLDDSKLSETSFSSSIQTSYEGPPQSTMIAMKFASGNTFGSLQEELALSAGTRHLSELRTYFDRSVDIDRRQRENFCEVVSGAREVYEKGETISLDKGMAMFLRFEAESAKSIAVAYPGTTAKMAFVKGDSRAWGWASGSVRADAVEVLAYLQDTMRRAGMRRDDVDKAIIETANNHSKLVYSWKQMPKIMSDRDFLWRALWRLSADENIELVTVPEDSAKRPPIPGVVRAKYPSAWRIHDVGGCKKLAKVEHVMHPDFGGTVPAWTTNLYVRRSLAHVSEVQDYFQRLRPLGAYDERDGAAIGEILMIKTKEEFERKKWADKYKIRVLTVFSNHAALKEFATSNPWFPSLVEGMLSSMLRGTVSIKTKLQNLSKREALAIGKSFAFAVFDRQVAEVAVGMFVSDYAALVDLSQRERWFIPLAVSIGQRKIEQAPWGLILTVGAGAVLGILDVTTDIYAIANFTTQGKHAYAQAVIASVSISMSIQVLMVYNYGKKRGGWHVMKEAMIVLSGLKPAVDAFRVIGGAKAHEDDTLDPMYELILAKVIEIVGESIPSSLVQLYAMLISPPGSVSAASIASVIVSIAAISLGSTTICFDFDLDPERRVHTPDFYGFLPNSSGKRTVLFYSIFCYTACHVALRLLGIALLAAVSPMITAAVLGGDMLFFMMFKLARNDLRYSLKLPGTMTWIASILIRFFTKLMVDFTVMAQLRHPQEIGGLYWCMCLLLGQTTSFVALHLYYSESEGAQDYHGEKSAINLWGLMGGLEVGFVVFFAIFIRMINKKYVGTFFSTMTAKQFRIKAFRDAKTDKIKMNVFKLHPSYYNRIRGEVKHWVSKRYETWIEEKPEWFTERVKKTIPIDMIPARLRAEKSSRKGKRVSHIVPVVLVNKESPGTVQAP